MTVAVISDNTGATYSGLYAVEVREQDATGQYYGGGYIGRGVEVQSYFTGERDHGFLFPTGLSNIPSGSTITGVTLEVYVTEAGATFDIALRRLLRSAVYNELTWNIWSTGNNWGTAGALNATDRNSTVLATLSVTNGMSAGYVAFSNSGLIQAVQDIVDGTISNQGWELECSSDTAYDGRYMFFSDNTQTDGQRPKLTVTYTVGGTDHPLSASAGSYSLTGVAATLKRSKLITASAGTYTFTGKAATLTKSKLITALTGSYTLTGVNATLAWASTNNYALTANAGSYVFTGVSATINKSKVLIANAGSYSLTGVAAQLASNRFLTASSGSYTFTGVNASLIRNKLITASAGAYTLTGVNASLLKSKALTASAGSYTLTGKDATLTKTTNGVYELVASTGSYALSGVQASISYIGLASSKVGGDDVPREEYWEKRKPSKKDDNLDRIIREAYAKVTSKEVEYEEVEEIKQVVEKIQPKIDTSSNVIEMIATIKQMIQILEDEEDENDVLMLLTG